MNENIIHAFQESNLSKYALAQRAGVPYTTVSEILNKKNDINKCAAETVLRLAAVLHAEPKALLNEIHILDGVKGTHMGVHYTLHFNGRSMEIRFEDRGEEVTIDTGQPYRIPERRDDYLTVTEWRIEDYFENRAYEEHAQQLFREMT